MNNNPFMMLGPDGKPLPMMPPMIGPDGQQMQMPMMNFNMPPMMGPDGQPMQMPMMNFNMMAGMQNSNQEENSEEYEESEEFSEEYEESEDGVPIEEGNNIPQGMNLPMQMPMMPPMMGPDGQPIQMPMMNFNMPPMMGPDGKPMQMPMMPPMIGPDGQPMQMPMMPPMVGPDGQPIQMPMMNFNMPPMMGPDGQPLPMPTQPLGNVEDIMKQIMNMGAMMAPVPSQEEFGEEDSEEYDEESDDGVPIEESDDGVPLDSDDGVPIQNVSTDREIQIPTDQETAKEDDEGIPIEEEKSEKSIEEDKSSKEEKSQTKSEETSSTPKSSTKKFVKREDINGSISKLSLRGNLIQEYSSNKKEAVKIDKKQKLITKNQTKSKTELQQFREKMDIKNKAAQTKFETEIEKIRLNLDKEQKNFEKQQLKAVKDNDLAYEELTKSTYQKQDKLVQSTESGLQSQRKEIKDSCTKEKNEVLAAQKEEISSKKRKKATFDKKYMKQLKLTHKNILTIYDKIQNVTLLYAKKYSDLELQQQQQAISCSLVEQTNKEIFLNNLKLLQEKHNFELNNYSSFMNQKIDVMQVCHDEQIQILKQIHEFEKNLFEKRFKEESELQQLLVQIKQGLLKKSGKKKPEIEPEIAKLSKETSVELDEVKNEQFSILEARLDRELCDLYFQFQCEIHQVKLEMAKEKVEMLKKFHKAENDLLLDRKAKDIQSLKSGHADMSQCYASSQKELFDFLGEQRADIEPILKDILEEHKESSREKITSYFQNTNRTLATQFKAKNAVLQKRQDNAEVALAETYDIRLKNLAEKCAQELKEAEETVSATEAAKPRQE